MDLETASCATVDGTFINALRDRLQADTGQPVALVETHISWVLLTERLAYKLKKPVHLPFVDFSTLTLRKHFARRRCASIGAWPLRYTWALCRCAARCRHRASG
jgi:hypothetical protein